MFTYIIVQSLHERIIIWKQKMSTVRQCFLYFCTFSPYQRNKTNNFKVDHVVFGLEVSIHHGKKNSEYHQNILGSSTSILN